MTSKCWNRKIEELSDLLDAFVASTNLTEIGLDVLFQTLTVFTIRELFGL